MDGRSFIKIGIGIRYVYILYLSLVSFSLGWCVHRESGLGTGQEIFKLERPSLNIFRA